jgi:putative methionine-R-sulfoxide reductase with GAF domain
LVIPLTKNGKVLGVLDLDSPVQGRFTQQDATELTRIFSKISQTIF